jgi:hypothetical protein
MRQSSTDTPPPPSPLLLLFLLRAAGTSWGALLPADFSAAALRGAAATSLTPGGAAGSAGSGPIIPGALLTSPHRVSISALASHGK